MIVAILTSDGATRVTCVVGSVETAQALYPGHLCVERGTGADLTAVDPVQTVAQSSTPEPVTAAQIRLALNRLGLRQAVEQAVSAGTQDLQDEWRFRPMFERNNPLVVQMIHGLGVSDAQADALWRLGATL